MNEHDRKTGSRNMSRRRFLGGLGAGAIAIGTGEALRAPSGRAAGGAPGAHGHGPAGVSTHFGRIFERMPPFADPGKRGLEAALDGDRFARRDSRRAATSSTAVRCS